LLQLLGEWDSTTYKEFKMSKRILVTGGNAGIGLALCTQLVLEHGCEVFLGSRNAERGGAAVSSIRDKIPANCAGSVELVNIDVASDESVAAAAAALAKVSQPPGSFQGFLLPKSCIVKSKPDI
jgi:NAD(P)-dependent dehydrogenase (short-subunit alcohol dehydrogenase family)